MDNNVEKVTQLKNTRSSKKGWITKRVDQLNRLVSEGGSRTKIKHLHPILISKYNEVKDLCLEISRLSNEDTTSWLEEVEMRVDSCTADVNDYLEARKDDPASTYTESWIHNHNDRQSVHSDDEKIDLPCPGATSVLSSAAVTTSQGVGMYNTATFPSLDSRLGTSRVGRTTCFEWIWRKRLSTYVRTIMDRLSQLQSKPYFTCFNRTRSF